jgi:hypothetical protein
MNVMNHYRANVEHMKEQADLWAEVYAGVYVLG